MPTGCEPLIRVSSSCFTAASFAHENLPTIHGTSGDSTSTQVSFDRKIRATHALALLSHHPRGRAGKALITSPLLSTVELISGNAQLRLSYGRTVRPAETSHGPHHRVDLARLVRCPGWDSNSDGRGVRWVSAKVGGAQNAHELGVSRISEFGH